MAKFSLESFKDAIKNDIDLKGKLAGNSDFVDYNNGTAVIHRENINKYLERYYCKSEEDLMDTLYYNYGIFAKII